MTSLSHLLKRLARRRADAAALKRAFVQAGVAEEKARQAEAQLREALDALPEGIVFLDADGRYVMWNKRYAEIYRRADILKPGTSFAETLRIAVARGDYPDAIGREEEWVRGRLAQLGASESRHEQRLADGRWLITEDRRTSGGGTIGIRVDITEMKQREASFRLLFENNPLPMFLCDRETLSIVRANAAAAAHYGYDPQSVVGMHVGALFHAEERRSLDLGAGPIEAQPDRTWRHVKADGEAIDVTLFSGELPYEGRPSIMLAAVDVTERRRAEARIAHMARHDDLTGLSNRAHHRDCIEAKLARLEASGRQFATLLLDLDHFKSVNDTLGHSVGDMLLREVSARLAGTIRVEDSVSRLGGDEFAILASSGDRTELTVLAQRLVSVVGAPYDLDGHQVVVGASIGIAVAPEDGDDPDRLLKSADVALYRAKADGRGTFCFFEPEMDAQLLARRAIEVDLRRAVPAGELEVHYQPLVSLGTGAVSGFEALLRWNHPERGWVLPEEFITVAEEIGLIGEIGQMVLRRACADAAGWPEHIKVAVNLSPCQFRSGGLVESVRLALTESQIDPGRLELEITEALLMDRSETVLATLFALRALGAGISMDDFGTGYSSLGYLRSFPFTKIKIDRSFMRNLAGSPDSRAIVRAVLSLGSSLGITVTAEGIENPDDLEYLKSEGCIEGQGFLFSAARRIDQVGELIGKSKDLRAA